MANLKFRNLLNKLVKFGVIHREEVKHSMPQLKRLLNKRYLRKTNRNGKVFYELTEDALAFLDNYRQSLLLELKNLNEVYPRNKVYFSLLNGDLRFLDESAPEAEEFRFLSDWQLSYPVGKSQLALSKARYFENLSQLEK
jgi:hypothetical protein